MSTALLTKIHKFQSSILYLGKSGEKRKKKKVIEMERNGVEINHWRLSVQKLEQYCDDVSYFFFFKHTYLT